MSIKGLILCGFDGSGHFAVWGKSNRFMVPVHFISLKSKTKLDYEDEWDEPIQPHNVKYNGSTRLSLYCVVSYYTNSEVVKVKNEDFIQL